MKKKTAVLAMTFIVGVLLYFTGIRNSKGHDYGAPAGYTNSPYDGKSCDYKGCHNTNPLQSPQPWITSNVPSEGYSPDTIYVITARAVDAGKTSFGFEISPQTTSGYPLGTLIVSNSTTTQIVTSHSLQYIEQTLKGYTGTDSLVWTFNWKAPAKGTGSVTFYGCFNCGTGNKSAANTYVFPATLVVSENTFAGIDNIGDKATSFTLFPNPAKEQINIAYNLKGTATVEVNMYNMQGKKVSTMMDGSVQTKGEYKKKFSLPASVNPGIYLIQLIADGQSKVQKIVIESQPFR
jgi:hypothetical protein